jgi:hypothetical protein
VNCVINENSVFSKPSIKDLLHQYTLVQLYTDSVPERYQPTTSPDENKQLQADKFGTVQLPLYVILKPLGGDKYEEVARYDEGKINNVAGFADFLRKPLPAGGRIASASP